MKLIISKLEEQCLKFKLESQRQVVVAYVLDKEVFLILNLKNKDWQLIMELTSTLNSICLIKIKAKKKIKVLIRI